MTQNLSTKTFDNLLLDVSSECMPLSLPDGSAILAYHGTVWITQEGLPDDFVLSPGERFAVKSHGLIVISSVRGNAKVWVFPPMGAAANVGDDVYARARACAHQLRREAVRDAVQAIRDRLSHAIAATAAVIRQAIHPSQCGRAH